MDIASLLIKKLILFEEIVKGKISSYINIYNCNNTYIIFQDKFLKLLIKNTIYKL